MGERLALLTDRLEQLSVARRELCAQRHERGGVVSPRGTTQEGGGVGELESSVWVSGSGQQGALPFQDGCHALQQLVKTQGQCRTTYPIQFLVEVGCLFGQLTSVPQNLLDVRL